MNLCHEDDNVMQHSRTTHGSTHHFFIENIPTDLGLVDRAAAINLVELREKETTLRVGEMPQEVVKVRVDRRQTQDDDLVTHFTLGCFRRRHTIQDDKRGSQPRV